MTSDELADQFKADLDELHLQIEALPEGATKRRAKRLASIAHGAPDGLKDLAVDGDMIQPLSGGDPKDPEP